jgi:ferritin-like metal-binding protein YciE
MATKNKAGNDRSNNNNDKNTSQGASDKGQGARTSGASGHGDQRQHKGLRKLFEHQLADLYYVEKQLLQHLPKMAEAAQGEELKEAFKEHLQETKGHVQHLEAIFKDLGRSPKAQKCEAIDGILQEGQQLMQDFKDDDALDAALVCAAQKVEHYEITTYGSLCAFAEQLGMDSVCDRLEEVLDQEKAADELLSELAESSLNLKADEDADDDDEQEGQGSRTQKARATA